MWKHPHISHWPTARPCPGLWSSFSLCSCMLHHGSVFVYLLDFGPCSQITSCMCSQITSCISLFSPLGYFLPINSSHSPNWLSVFCFFSLLIPSLTLLGLHSSDLSLLYWFWQFFIVDFILIKEKFVLNLNDLSLRGLNLFKIWCCTMYFYTYAPWLLLLFLRKLCLWLMVIVRIEYGINHNLTSFLFCISVEVVLCWAFMPHQLYLQRKNYFWIKDGRYFM